MHILEDQLPPTADGQEALKDDGIWTGFVVAGCCWFGACLRLPLPPLSAFPSVQRLLVIRTTNLLVAFPSKIPNLKRPIHFGGCPVLVRWHSPGNLHWNIIGRLAEFALPPGRKPLIGRGWTAERPSGEGRN